MTLASWTFCHQNVYTHTPAINIHLTFCTRGLLLLQPTDQTAGFLAYVVENDCPPPQKKMLQWPSCFPPPPHLLQWPSCFLWLAKLNGQPQTQYPILCNRHPAGTCKHVTGWFTVPLICKCYRALTGVTGCPRLDIVNTFKHHHLRR